MAVDIPSPIEVRDAAGSQRRNAAPLAGVVMLAVAFGVCIAALGVVAADPATPRSDEVPDVVDARRARIEQMSNAEKDSLARALERFKELDRDEQQRLRELRRKIESSPDSAQLEQIVHGYYDWLATLTAGKRAEIQALPPEQRVVAVERELKDESRRNKDRLSLQDYIVLADWLREEFEARLLEMVPEDKREQFRNQPPAFRRATVVYMVARRMRDDGPRPLEMLSSESIDQLTSRLSPSSREQLERAGSLEAQRRVVGRWLYDFQRSIGRRQFGSLLGDISEKELTDFFEQELSDEQRESLLALSPEEMWHDLRVEYVRQQMPVPELFEGRSFRGRGDFRGGNSGGRPDGRPGGRPDGFERRLPPPGGALPPGPPGQSHLN